MVKTRHCRPGLGFQLLSAQMLFLFSDELVLSEGTEELSLVLQCISTKKKRQLFFSGKCIESSYWTQQKEPGCCGVGNFRLFQRGFTFASCPSFFFFFFFVEVDCKTNDNSSVTNAKIHFQIPLSLSSTLSSLKLPCPTRCRRR